MAENFIDTHYTVNVDNSANSDTKLRYCRWDDDEENIVVTEVEDATIDLNKEYCEDPDGSEAYITMPLTLLSFALKDEETTSPIASKICCPTNMVGFNKEGEDYSFVDAQYLGSENNPFVTGDYDIYRPFGYYAAFEKTITDSSIFYNLMVAANTEFGGKFVIDELIIPETMTSLETGDFMDIREEYGGGGVTIGTLIVQGGSEYVDKLIQMSSSFLEYLSEKGTYICFTDDEGEKVFKEMVDKGELTYDTELEVSVKDYIKKSGGEIPDIKKIKPEKKE